MNRVWHWLAASEKQRVQVERSAQSLNSRTAVELARCEWGGCTAANNKRQVGCLTVHLLDSYYVGVVKPGTNQSLLSPGIKFTQYALHPVLKACINLGSCKWPTIVWNIMHGRTLAYTLHWPWPFLLAPSPRAVLLNMTFNTPSLLHQTARKTDKLADKRSPPRTPTYQLTAASLTASTLAKSPGT